jgi:hypothetical protein
MENRDYGDEALDLANSILKDLDKKNINPVFAYAALGCAFLQLHRALGNSSEDWIEMTQKMSKITHWEKEKNET